MADRDDQPVLGTAGDFYSRLAPLLAHRSKSSALFRSTATCLGLRACRRRATDRGKSTGRYGRAAHVPRRPAQRGTGGPDLEAVGNEPARMPRKARYPARGAAKLAGRPACRRRSRARPSCFSAGQLYYDRTYLQQIELCDKKVDTKIVDETSLYNIRKGRPMFFSTI
jgi:hypothetical protein